MNPIAGTAKVNFRQVARELNISATTLYRVLNNVNSVRHETRERVIGALNRYGCFSHAGGKANRIVFDFSTNGYLLRHGTELMQKLSIRDFTCTITDHRKQEERFWNAVSGSDIVVFCSEPEPETLDLLRRSYPEVFTLSLFGHAPADITLTGNDQMAAEIGSQHLYRNGHRHIAVHTLAPHKDGLPRYRRIQSEFTALDPACRIDHVVSQEWNDARRVWREYFAACGKPPTAAFFTTGPFAGWSRQCWRESDPAAAAKISILTFDDIDRQDCRCCDEPIDCIAFSIPNLLCWAEYYINNRPIFTDRMPIVCGAHMELNINGSVKNLH